MTTARFAAFAYAAIMLAVPSIAAAPDTIKARQDNFKAMGRSMKLISDELKKDAPVFATVRREAAALERAGKRIPGFFPRGTGAAAGVNTDALPAIWQKPADFRTAATKLNGATKALRTAAAGTDAARIRAALGATGATCKGCHDQFRLDK
ncbi:MAG: cytochrome c [Sphingopyxis sp.]|nr:cytochrome c [Sphingopyxis sp.]